ncbi:hypothetical protein [Cupriavidus campinensis]
MGRHRLACLGGTVLACAACAATPHTAEQAVSLTGELRVSGTAQFPMVVLLASDRQAWALTGIAAKTAQPLSGRQVTVHGTVLRAPGPDVWMPSIRIEGMPKLRDGPP